MHEGDASFLVEHLLLTCPTLFKQILWGSSMHTLLSLLVHEGFASFLVGHLLFASVLSPW